MTEGYQASDFSPHLGSCKNITYNENLDKNGKFKTGLLSATCYDGFGYKYVKNKVTVKDEDRGRVLNCYGILRKIPKGQDLFLPLTKRLKNNLFQHIKRTFICSIALYTPEDNNSLRSAFKWYNISRGSIASKYSSTRFRVIETRCVFNDGKYTP